MADAKTGVEHHTDAFYLLDGGRLRASAWTRGPWDLGAQHGGPPSALMARAIEHLLGDERDAWVPARVLVELLRPVPIATLDPRAAIESRGRRAIRAAAALEHEGVEIARARAVLLRAAPDEGSLERAPEDLRAPLPPPDSWSAFDFPFFLDPVGYHRAMEIRIGDRWPGASARAWSRMRVPLVRDAWGRAEEPTGWQRALTFADAAHGCAPALDPSAFAIVNPDLELTLARRPEGEWIGLDVRTWTSALGTGLTRSRVLDHRGLCGATSATLVVRPR